MAFVFETPIANPTPCGEFEALSPGWHELSHRDIPATWFQGENLANLYWGEEKLVLPSNPHERLLEVRGTDIPDFTDLGPKPKTKSRPELKNDASLLFVDSKTNKVRESFGGQRRPLKDGRMRISVQLDSQLPSLTVENKTGDEKNYVSHRVVLHGSNCMKDVTVMDPASVRQGQLGIAIPACHEKAADEGRLFALIIEFADSSIQQRILECIKVIHRSRAEDMDRWSSQDDMKATMKSDKPLSGFDVAIHRMFVLQNMKMVFLKEVDTPDIKCIPRYRAEYDYWASNMKLALEHGSFWFYSMQPNFDRVKTGAHLNFWAKADNPPPVPFWLVTKFRALVQGTELTKLTPFEFGHNVQDPTSVDYPDWTLPSPKIACLLQELGMLRERAWQYTASEIMFTCGRSHPMIVRTIDQDHAGKKAFLEVEISVVASVDEGTQSKAGQIILPDRGSRLKLTLHLGKDGRQSTTIEGRVVDGADGVDSNTDLTVFCAMPMSRALSLMQWYDKKDRLHTRGTITVKNNFTSADRIIQGFRRSVADIDEKRLLETKGPSADPRKYLLDYPPRFPGAIRDLGDVDKIIGDYATKVCGAGSSFKDVCAYFGFPGLNPSQLQAIVQAIKSDKGNLAIVHGPPATGKSRTLACLAVVLKFVFGSKMVIAAPSNHATNVIMEKIVEAYEKTMKPKGLKMELVRFLGTEASPVGSNVATLVGPEGLPEEEGLDELTLRRRELWKVDARWAHWTFHEKKKALARGFLANADSDPKARAFSADWLQMLEDAVSGNFYGEKIKRYGQVDDYIGQQVLQNRCDILLGTLNSMGKTEVLVDCEFDTAIIDEASQASIGEIAIPSGTFKQSLVRVVLGGDDLQLPAYMASERANEATPFVRVSTFKKLRLAVEDFSVTLLACQYRCHPHIYKWSNQTLYEGKVNNNEAVGKVTGLDKTVIAFLNAQTGHLGHKGDIPKWNPSGTYPRVVVIDINHKSSNWPGTASQWNELETAFGLFLRKGLLGTVPPADGKAITPQDVTMISPYRGQVAAFRKNVSKQGTACLTVQTSQGDEFTIGISSFAMNDPDKVAKLGFVWVPAHLNVWTTRPQRFHFILGNFSARYRVKSTLKQARAANATYIKLLDHVCSGKEPGVVVLQPRDFKDWPIRSPLEDITDEPDGELA